MLNFSCSNIADDAGLNMGYWLVLSGVNMTLLPMILVDPAFVLSSVEVGSVFAGISVVSPKRAGSGVFVDLRMLDFFA